MKRFNRVCIYIFVLLVSSFGNAFALNFSDIPMGAASRISEATKSYEFSDGLVKKERTSTICYMYPENLKDSSHKYVTVRIDLTYLSSITGKILAVAVIESNFRCNTVTKQAECLSTSRGNVVNDTSCVLNICSRRANLNTEVGASTAEVKFTHKGKTYESNAYRISCDYMGNVICI